MSSQSFFTTEEAKLLREEVLFSKSKWLPVLEKTVKFTGTIWVPTPDIYLLVFARETSVIGPVKLCRMAVMSLVQH